jgi:hypothetical protein
MSRRRHKPSEKTREFVAALAVNGVKPSRIAACTGIPENILRRHYGDTLDLAMERVRAQAANTSFCSPGSGLAVGIAAMHIGARGRWRDVSPTECQIEPKYPKSLSGMLQRARAGRADSDANGASSATPNANHKKETL